MFKFLLEWFITLFLASVIAFILLITLFAVGGS